MKTISIGHIADTRFWLSIESQPITYGHPYWVKLGKTYNGTIRGLVARVGRFVIIAHQRGRDPQ